MNEIIKQIKENLFIVSTFLIVSVLINAVAFIIMSFSSDNVNNVWLSAFTQSVIVAGVITYVLVANTFKPKQFDPVHYAIQFMACLCGSLFVWFGSIFCIKLFNLFPNNQFDVIGLQIATSISCLCLGLFTMLLND